MRASQKISLSSLTNRFPYWVRVLRFIMFWILLPYCVPAAILTLPIFGFCKFFFKLLKDHAFRNSVRFIVNLIIWPVIVLIYSIIAFCIAPWEWALAFTALVIPAPLAAQEMWRLFRLEISDIKLLCNRKLREKYTRIQQIVLNLK